MAAQIRIRWALLALLCACGEPDGPADGPSADAGPGDAAREAGASDPGDAAPGDAAPGDVGPDAEVFEVVPVACPRPDDDGLTRVELQPPGSWRLEDCSGRVDLRFMVPPDTAWRIEATSSAVQAPIVTIPAGESPVDAPEEVASLLYFDRDHPPVVTIRWVECVRSERCGADRYCVRAAFTCTDCADGDELFDTRQSPAPRTDARPRALVDGWASGEVCRGFDDWYAVQQPAGQPLHLVDRALAYVADPAAGTLADLEPIPLIAPPRLPGHGPDVEPTRRMVPPAEAARTVWVRLSTDEARWRYTFAAPRCGSSAVCLPWWWCDRDDEGGLCRACAGMHDAHGDDDVRRSPGGAPIPLAPGQPLDGAICGADEDWYAVTLGDPASRIEITGAVGFAYVPDAVSDPATAEASVLEAGAVIVLRSDMPEWYPDLQTPEVVWVNIATDMYLDDFPGTYPYTIRVEDGDFCAPDRFPCPDGRVCDADSGRCIAAEP